jgi:enolase
MTPIEGLHAGQILDGRGEPTVEVDVWLSTSGFVSATAVSLARGESIGRG